MEQTRRMLILRAVVEDYIRSQEPVGSSALTRKHHLGVSSATVRNDMAALEDMGYLIQPHTSAGRIPTELGYRYFVDRLSTVMTLSPAQKRAIGAFLNGSVSLQDTLQRSARLLASITGQVAVISSPALSKSVLRHMELVPLATETLLLVVITDTGSVVQHTLRVDSPPDPSLLDYFTRKVNESSQGLSLSEAAMEVRGLALAPEFSALRPLADGLAITFASMAEDEQATDMYMAGTSRLAHQQSLNELAPLFDALEEQVVIMRLMSSLSEESNDVGVAIGSETHTPGLLNASVVSSGYGHSFSSNRTDGGTGSEGSAQASRGPDLRGQKAQGYAGDRAQPGIHKVDTGHIQASEPSGVAVQATGASAGQSPSPDKPVAFVGSIGPTHMDYAATMTAVRAVARYLTALISPTGEEG
ncbi:heat-inducible transcriptional repressor HrcA [Bifidobacterium aemilianum]|uniref:Heat-inducible transcription repressor HrcA n=1 Tax=Bifidobacterium aemilianum TaxID=2493120 RepID=A0A366KAE9_9BIFI|nr:heat-inducible transcriptional repressor HrcA [Bifidobacterium aemilianum]RBP98083.1 heat-inducible transcriptional repressor HrcA [Bifidobacterium aemilianum]